MDGHEYKNTTIILTYSRGQNKQNGFIVWVGPNTSLCILYSITVISYQELGHHILLRSQLETHAKQAPKDFNMYQANKHNKPQTINNNNNNNNSRALAVRAADAAVGCSNSSRPRRRSVRPLRQPHRRGCVDLNARQFPAERNCFRALHVYPCDARLADEVAGLVDESVRLYLSLPATQRTTPSGTNLPPSTLLVGCTREALLLRQRVVRGVTPSPTSRTSGESEGSAQRANRTSRVSEDAAVSVVS